MGILGFNRKPRKTEKGLKSIVCWKEEQLVDWRLLIKRPMVPISLLEFTEVSPAACKNIRKLNIQHVQILHKVWFKAS